MPQFGSNSKITNLVAVFLSNLMKSGRFSWVIHVFALLHAAVALGCRIAGVDDELLLTILTMSMALILCKNKGVSIEFTAAIIIVVNIIGFLLGTVMADVIGTIVSSEYAVGAMATALTTEVLGWSIIGITRFFHQKEQNRKSLSSSSIKWVLFIVGGIFILRLIIVLFFTTAPFHADCMFDMTKLVLTNTLSLTVLVCLNILYVRFVASLKGFADPEAMWKRILKFLSFLILTSGFETLLVGIGMPAVDSGSIWVEYGPLFIVSIMLQLTLYSIIYMTNYALVTRNAMHEEREKANMVQFRYLKLKRLVNPHFLFNSLNILDCLICEEEPEQASLYTHKLAGIYRYMIRSEEEDVVPLREELVFVNLYVDLLKVRFPKGFEVNIDVPEEIMSMFVPPCSIQLLIENATKHNAVNSANPLVVNVVYRDGCISVSNNIIPKETKTPSTGLGQQYIRQLYLDLSGKSIEISRTDDKYCVTLPLL